MNLNFLKNLKLQYILIFLIIIAEVFRLTLPFFYNPINAIWSDPGRWWEYGGTGIDTPPLALIDPLLFQVWMSMVAKLTLGIPELTALYAGLLSALTPWLWYRFFRELLANKNLALLGWLLIAILPSWIGIFSYFMSETLLLPLLGLALWLCMRSLRKQEVNSFILASFIATLCILTRGITAPMLFFTLVIVWLQQKHKLQSAIYSILLCSLILGSLSYRSYVKTGMISPLGQPMLNAIYAKSGNKEIGITYYSNTNYGFGYGFGNPSTGEKPFKPFSDWKTARQGKVNVRVDIMDLGPSWEKALEYQQKHQNALPHLQLIKENLIFLFFGSSWPDNNPQHIVENISNIMRFIWLPLTLITLLLMIKKMTSATLIRNKRKHEKSENIILLSLILSWFIFQGIFLISVNEGRYRKPIEGILIAMVLVIISNKNKGNSQAEQT